jgi:hypothetical protein
VMSVLFTGLRMGVLLGSRKRPLPAPLSATHSGGRHGLTPVSDHAHVAF